MTIEQITSEFLAYLSEKYPDVEINPVKDDDESNGMLGSQSVTIWVKKDGSAKGVMYRVV